MSIPVASLHNVLAWRDGRERAAVAYQRNWGPVRSREAAAAGCVRCATSVVITPDIPPGVVAHALQCVPDEVLPRADDSAEVLAARLGASLFLDDAEGGTTHHLSIAMGDIIMAPERTPLPAALGSSPHIHAALPPPCLPCGLAEVPRGCPGIYCSVKVPALK